MSNNSILIIGAGMAGLSAAKTLHDAGLKVTMLEARERIGGRIWTNNKLGTPVDLGASWIHGIKKNPIQDLAKQYQVKTLPTDWDSVLLYDADGNVIPDKKLDRAESILERMIEQLDTDREALDDDTSLKAGFDSLIAQYDLSVEERQILSYVIANEIEHDYATNTSDMSLWWWDQDEEFKGKHVIFPQGYHQLIARLAEDIDIHLKTVVKEITYDNDSVTVKTSNNETFTASYGLVTVPLGVLKSGAISFNPPLPAKKQRAIEHLKMGIFHKTYLRFPHVFWDKEYEFIGYSSGEKDEWVTWMNYHYHVDEPILLAINTGAYARKLETLTDEQVINRGMSVLRTIYGNAVPQPTDYLITSWGKDPHSVGAYSYIPVGASDKDYEMMAQPVNDRIFFAGEATTRQYPSTVHGAYLSGQREAQQIRKLLNR